MVSPSRLESEQDELLNARAALIDQIAPHFAEQIRLSRDRASHFEAKAEALNEKCSALATEIAVLRKELDWTRSQTRIQGWQNWLLNFLFAFGGAVCGFGISWPQFDILPRGIITVIGVILICIPCIFKFAVVRSEKQQSQVPSEPEA